MKVQIKRIAFSLSILLFVFMTCFKLYNVHATAGAVDLLDERLTASLNLQLRYTPTEGKWINIDGAHVEIYLLATLKQSAEQAVVYTLTKDFRTLGTRFDAMTASESMDVAAKANVMLEGSGIKPLSAGVTQDGELTFNDLPYGMYLIRQVKRTGASLGFSEMRPFLVSVPNAVLREDGRYVWQYDVKVLPKSEVEVIPTTTPVSTEPTPTPVPTTTGPVRPPSKTGESAGLLTIVILLLAGMTAVRMFFCRRSVSAGERGQ